MSLLTDRKAFEQWYACNAFNYEHNPIGSRECGLQWAAWQAAQAALIKKLATVSVEPDLIKTDEVDRYGDSLYVEAYSAEALAAARVQAIEEAAKVCESLFDMDDDSCNEAETCAKAIRALIGGSV